MLNFASMDRIGNRGLKTGRPRDRGSHCVWNKSSQPTQSPHVTWRFAVPFGRAHIANLSLLHIPLAEKGGDKVILKLFFWVNEKN